MFIYEISIILICRKLGSVGSVQQKIKLPLPNLQLLNSFLNNLISSEQINYFYVLNCY